MARHNKNTNAKVERANGVISGTLRAYANGCKDDWDGHLQLTVFVINNTASILGGDLTPFSLTAAHTPGSRSRRLATTARRTSPRHITSTACG